MTKVELGSILIEQKKSVKTSNGNSLDLIGVSNEIGLHISRAKRIDDLSRYKFIKNGWFAYNPMRINVGSIGYVYKEEQIGIVSPDYVVFSCSDKILPEYLLYILKSDEGIEAINRNASGAVRKRLYFSDLARIEIVLPSIESQTNRLVAFRKIKHLGNKISEHSSQGSLLTQLKQSILQEAIQGKLTADWRALRQAQEPQIEPASELLKRIKAEKNQLIKDKKIKKEKALPPISEEEIPFELPEGWVWCRLGEVIILRSGQDLTISEYNDKREGIPYLTGASHIYNGKVNVSRWTNTPKSISNIGDLLLTCKGTIGKMVFNTIGDIHIARQIMAINTINDTEIVFVKCFLENYTSELLKNAKSLIPGISRNDILHIVFPFPPFQEQQTIVEKVESLMQKCQGLEQEIKTSEANAQMLMQAVLKEAFEGERAVVEA